MIWEAAIPEEVHPRSKIFAIWGDKPATTPRAIANIRLLACCHESRHLAEKNGNFVPLKRLPPVQGPPRLVWIDRNVEIVSIPFEPIFLDRIIRLPPNVTTLADTIGNTYSPLSEETAGKYLEKWRNDSVVDIDTFYFGLDDQLPMYVFQPPESLTAEDLLINISQPVTTRKTGMRGESMFHLEGTEVFVSYGPDGLRNS
jgi:hypothetical protein